MEKRMMSPLSKDYSKVKLLLIISTKNKLIRSQKFFQ